MKATELLKMLTALNIDNGLQEFDVKIKCQGVTADFSINIRTDKDATDKEIVLTERYN